MSPYGFIPHAPQTACDSAALLLHVLHKHELVGLVSESIDTQTIRSN